MTGSATGILDLHAIVNDTLDALIIAGDLTDGPAPRWIRGLPN